MHILRTLRNVMFRIVLKARFRLRSRVTKLALVAGVVVLVYGAIFFINEAPSNFPAHTPFEIEEGLTLSDISKILKEQGLIRSEAWFKFVAVSYGSAETLKASSYVFPRPLSTTELVDALEGGQFTDLVRITIFEGWKISQIAENVALYFPKVDKVEFEQLAAGKEGYLYPETYLIARSATAKDIIALLTETHRQVLDTYKDEIAASGKTELEILTMASILEREGNTRESKEIIAGILWKRIDEHMPLQADATLNYVLDKTSAELTYEDLEMESPYNTYKYQGLPPGPIANPGADAIEAALNPKSSTYYFYLSDDDGNFHFARTFAEHKLNKERYLY